MIYVGVVCDGGGGGGGGGGRGRGGGGGGACGGEGHCSLYQGGHCNIQIWKKGKGGRWRRG